MKNFFFECQKIRCGENIAYITVGIIFRERNDGNLELLLTQEAKRRCLGKLVFVKKFLARIIRV